MKVDSRQIQLDIQNWLKECGISTIPSCSGGKVTLRLDRIDVSLLVLYYVEIQDIATGKRYEYSIRGIKQILRERR